MKDRPILFSAPMVRALLDGSKTQTRRIMKPQPEWTEPESVWQHGDGHSGTGWYVSNSDYPEEGALFYRFPYGQPGDLLWVRENGWEAPDLSPRDLREGADTWPAYEYDTEPLMCWENGELKKLGWKRRPSIHMPRWASRITLEVTGVRVERLQDISRGDAMAEGCPFPNMAQGDDPRKWYADLWHSINGPDSWILNPWVWVVEFKVMKS